MQCMSSYLLRRPHNADRLARLPSPLYDIPTDADYAMEIIARRITQGESISADKKQVKMLAAAYGDRSKRDLALPNKSRTSVNTVGTPLSPTTSIQPPSSVMTGIDGRSAVVDEPSTARPSDVSGTTAVGNSVNGADTLVAGPFEVSLYWVLHPTRHS